MKNPKFELLDQYKNNSSVGIFVIVFFKLILLALFSSEYSLSLFQPFVREFTDGNLNPWQYFYENGLNLDAFPYHSLMLYFLTPAMLVINFLNVDNLLISNFIFKLPLFIADVVIFYTFLKLFPAREKKIYIYYFCNPIIIYAIYIHSQLDIIPMALLMLGIYFLTKDKLKMSAILIGLALATKFHVLVAIPLLFFYLLKKYNIKEAITYFVISFGILVFFDLPYVLSEGFKVMVLFNPKQSLLFDSFLNIPCT